MTYRNVPAEFDVLACTESLAGVTLSVSSEVPAGFVIGQFVAEGEPVPAAVNLINEALEQWKFKGKKGQSLAVPDADGVKRVLVGLGDVDPADSAAIRDAAACVVRTAGENSQIALILPDAWQSAGARSAVEGALLAAYRYSGRKTSDETVRLSALHLVVAPEAVASAESAAEEACVAARATYVARDLTNAPPAHLRAVDMADVAARLGAEFGFEVEAFGRDELAEMGCGALLGVNAGSAEEPRMIKLSYLPRGATQHIAFAGKGITYDSGGISLKPSDPMHLLMKMDMGGAAAVLGAFSALRDAGVEVAVTGYLSCTDNMPSGSATKLGDVLTARNGTTIEVKNTDAEGRLVLADALSLAAEEKIDAVVDIATLTGAALMALGPLTAAYFANDDDVAAAVDAASAHTGEQTWRLPLERAYREGLNSDVADISNMGGRFAGSTTAALFLEEFVGDVPWAHLDIAGPMSSEKDDAWRSKGATGYGARTLLEFAHAYGK